jgi:hypothetical protein
MRKFLIVLALAALAHAATGSAARAQTPQSSSPSTTTTQTTDSGITPNGVVGEVTAIDLPSKIMTLKTDAGRVVFATVSDATIYMRVPPGEKTLDKAAKIKATEVGVGDRVFARGKVADDRKSVPARVLVVMTKADIAQKQERDRAEWQRRGIVGVITALNPTAKEITLTMRGRGAAQQPVVINASAANVTFRRYAADSVKFSDARPSSFDELKVGDQLRALGEKSADGTHLTPEEIVSGSFRTIGGPVLSINAAINEVKLNDLVTRQPFTVSIRQDSVLRRIPPEMAAMMAMRMGGSARGAGGPGGPVGGGAPGQAGGGRPQGAGTNGGSTVGPGGGPRTGGGVGGGGVDFQEILERLPAITLAELKAGDMIIVSSTSGAEAGRVTAIAVVSGVEPLLNAMQAQQAARPAGGGGQQGASSTGINFGIGLP